MQTPFIPALFALALSAGLAFADSGTTATQTVDDCPITGQATGLSQDCSTLRATFHAGMTDCLQAKAAKAETGTGAHYTHNAHTNRARALICDREVRERMGLAD